MGANKRSYLWVEHRVKPLGEPLAIPRVRKTGRQVAKWRSLSQEWRLVKPRKSPCRRNGKP